MLHAREIDIIYLLAEKSDALSIAFLSKHFNVGERSIRYHIENINVFMQKESILIHKGLCSLLNKDELLASLTKENVSLYSSDLKKKCLLYQIVFKNKVNLTLFSEYLEVSRTSIKHYFDEIRILLSSYHLDLQHEHKKGFLLIGEEHAIRKLQLQTLIEYDKLKAFEKEVLEPFLIDYIQEDTIQVIKRFLFLIQKELHTVLSGQSYSIVEAYLQILITRTQKQCSLTSSNQQDFLCDCSEYYIIEKHLPFIEGACKIQLSATEIFYFVDLFIGSHYSSDFNLKENNWFEYELLVSKIINIFSHEYPINLHQDYLLYQSLITHLKPTLYRLLNNIKITEVDHDMVFKQFPREFNATKKTLNQLHFFTNVHIDSDEIALITLHFKAAINRHQSLYAKKTNILIVCSHGYGTSQLLKQQLIDAYDVHIVDCIPSHFLNNMKCLDTIDLIITTIPNLHIENKIPMIKVDPILTDHNFALLDNTLLIKQKNKIRMSQLLQIIGNSCLIKDKTQLEQQLQESFSDTIINDTDHFKYSLLHLLPPQNIKLNLEVSTWEEAIRYGGQLLEQSMFSTASYTSKLLTSFENYGSYMVIDEGVAIPHSKSDSSVIRTGMSLTILKHPVIFHDEKQLSIFFTFCSKDNNEHIDALVSIANLIKESKFKEELVHFKNEDDVANYIYNFVASEI